jgi:tetratricopeptide (TPR) repeat protein
MVLFRRKKRILSGFSSLNHSKPVGKRVTVSPLLLLLLVFCFMLSCAGTDLAPGEAEKEPPASEIIITEEEHTQLDKIKDLILFGSPRSLEEALDLLRSIPEGTNPKGIELTYLAEQIRLELYPELNTRETVSPPVGSIYPELFESLRSKELPSFPASAEEDPILYFLPALVLFHTQERDLFLSVQERITGGEAFLAFRSLSSVYPPFFRGYIAEKRGDWDPAIGFYQSALKIDPSCYTASLRIARLQILRREPKKAKKELDNAKKYVRKDIVVLSALEAGIEYLEKGTVEQADQIGELLKDHPNNYFLLNLRSMVLFDRGNWDGAMTLAKIALQEGEDNPLLLFIRASVHEEKGDFLASEELLAGGYPTDLRIKELYGKVLISLGRREEGKEYLLSVVEQQPQRISALVLLFENAYAQGDWQEAAFFLERILPLKTSKDLLEKGYQVYTALENEEKQFFFAKSLYNEYPDSPETSVPYIQELIRRGRKADAVEIIQEVLTREDLARKTKSFLYYLQSTAVTGPDKRERLLQKALFEDLENLSALLALAELNRLKGSYHKAYQYMKQAAALAPERKDVSEKLNEYEKLIR